MQCPKRRQYKHAKSRYRVKNWREYEAGLRRRGDLTVWLSDEALDRLAGNTLRQAWWPASLRGCRDRGGADDPLVFHLPLRQTEGFLRSLSQMLDVDLPIPDHTTLSRRLQKLGEIQIHGGATNRPMHLLIDSTGLRIHVSQLRKPPRDRAWRKLHLAVDAETDQIVASELTGHRTRDSTRLPTLLEQTSRPSGVHLCGWRLR